ncbi:MAG: hypothetical protein ACO1OT_18760 [Heyndrickxia sp.]
MKNGILEYIKVASFVVIAISLLIIAWKTVGQVNELQRINDMLSIISNRVSH